MPTPEDFALQKMREAHLPESLISVARYKYKEKQRDDIIELNLLGFLQKANYADHYSEKGLAKCRSLLRDYKNTLARASQLYGVSPEYIAALIWVESKNGKVLGRFSLASVYYSLLQADHPTIRQHTTELALQLRPDPKVADEVRNQVRERSAQKAALALGELQALAKMAKGRDLRKLKGSYAGAFGLPQFLPTSYLVWSKTSRQGVADLNRMPDAILSIANYLHANGWDDRTVSAQRAALFHYNHSDGYVDVILKIANELKKIQSK